MQHLYRDVPGLGTVVFSRHAQDQVAKAGISEEVVKEVLLAPTRPDRSDGGDIVWREGRGIRLVILTNPTPNTGSKLVKTVYRVQAQFRVR